MTERCEGCGTSKREVHWSNVAQRWLCNGCQSAKISATLPVARG